MDITEVWELCISLMWDASYIKSLDAFLKDNNVNTILDCGGGTGFPCIELKKLGWNISYCDNNKTMIEHFSKKINKLSMNIPTFNTDWRTLSENIPQKFDALLCRGNSLIYVDSWETTNPTLKRENIKRVLREFYQRLNEKGLLYIDIINQKEFNQKYPLIENIGEKIINGKKVKVTWEITHSPKKKRRKCDIILNIEDYKNVTTCYSYLLTQEELSLLMTECGFKNVHNVKIIGENNYTVYVGYK